MIGVAPAVSQDAVDALDEVERRIGRRLSASVREWYSLEGACDLLLRYSNRDAPVAIEDLGKRPRETLKRGLLLFQFESQEVCVWAVRLDGREDPPVVVEVDSEYRIWTPCAESFSKHIYTRVWDHAMVLQRPPFITAQNQGLTAETLAFLREHFEVGPVTHGWPGHTQHRFVRDDQRLLIFDGEGQADWRLAADCDDSLLHLIATIRDCDEVGKALWSGSEAGKSLLSRACGSPERADRRSSWFH